MSKVVHLSDTAHRQAKEYCTPRSLKMSDWVGMLIEEATEASKNPTSRTSEVMVDAPASLVLKKRVPGYDNVEPQTDDDGTPIYAAPPFWARNNTAH